MSRSEKKTDIWGDEYIQHYGDNGEKSGTSRTKTDIWGDEYEQHYDKNDNKSGYTTAETNVWGDDFEQHRDQDSSKAGFSTDEADVWGDKYEQHRDQAGRKTGYTTGESDIWGDQYKQHHQQNGSGNRTEMGAKGRSNNGSGGFHSNGLRSNAIYDEQGHSAAWFRSVFIWIGVFLISQIAGYVFVLLSRKMTTFESGADSISDVFGQIILTLIGGILGLIGMILMIPTLLLSHMFGIDIQ